MVAPKFRLRIDFGPHASLGPGKIALLEAVREMGSLSEAARKLAMSYRRAWLLLAEINGSFAELATLSAVGGSGGGGMQVTAFGRALISSYREFEQAVGAIGTRRFAAIAARVVKQKTPGSTVSPRPLKRRVAIRG